MSRDCQRVTEMYHRCLPARRSTLQRHGIASRHRASQNITEPVTVHHGAKPITSHHDTDTNENHHAASQCVASLPSEYVWNERKLFNT